MAQKAAALAAELRQIIELVDPRGGHRHVEVALFAPRLRQIAREAAEVSPEAAALATQLAAAI